MKSQWHSFLYKDKYIVLNEFEIRPDPTMDTAELAALDQFKKSFTWELHVF